MTNFSKEFPINRSEHMDKSVMIDSIATSLSAHGYTIAEIDDERPWGGFIKLQNEDAERFVGDFYQGLSLEEAKLGNEQAELSPKILVVAPGQRLSWQYHNRRAERWVFLTKGYLERSMTDESEGVEAVNPFQVVQFAPGERHRLVGQKDAYSIVAEIWQHTDPTDLSDEDDIVRLADDYKRDSMADRLTA